MLPAMSNASGDVVTIQRPSMGVALEPKPTELPPHPILPAYYRDVAGKRPFLRAIFDATAGDYDKVERVLALGSGPSYRRRSLERAGLKHGERVLDVAMGTGLVAREAIRIVGDPALVVGVDPSIGMITEARRTLDVAAVLGAGESLPISDETFDLVSMGYALRHLPDLARTFAEFRRVLKPGGRVCILEISRPSGRIARATVAAYFRAVLPVLSRIIGTSVKTRELWHYYWETIDACVPRETVLQTLRDAGFVEERCRVDLGIFHAFTATRR